MRVSISIFAKKSKILENSEQRKYFVNREDRGWKDRDGSIMPEKKRNRSSLSKEMCIRNA